MGKCTKHQFYKDAGEVLLKSAVFVFAIVGFEESCRLIWGYV